MQSFLECAMQRFENAKDLGDRTLDQLQDADYSFRLDGESNSIAVLIQHLHGNMMSRWTDFLESDGEKEWRDRDAEFEERPLPVAELRARWEAGWACLFSGLAALKHEDLDRTITIRRQPLSVLDSILRQLAHANYHVGQMVLLARHLRGAEWHTLSIARGQSRGYEARPKD